MQVNGLNYEANKNNRANLEKQIEKSLTYFQTQCQPTLTGTDNSENYNAQACNPANVMNNEAIK